MGTSMERISSDDEPFSALAFKIMTDPFVGTLTFCRIYSGILNAGDGVYNSVKGQRERVGRMLQMHANDRTEVKSAVAGDIIAVAGLKQTTTGETLCDKDNAVILEKMDFPEPVISVAVEAKSKKDQDKMGEALARLAAEDPSFRTKYDEENAQTIISGMGELHLEIIVDRLQREFGVEANVGPPQGPVRAARGRGVRGLCVRERDQGRRRAEGVHSRRPEGHRRCAEDRCLGGLPCVRYEG